MELIADADKLSVLIRHAVDECYFTALHKCRWNGTSSWSEAYLHLFLPFGRYVACKQMTLDEFRRMASRFESKRRLSAKRNRYNYRANVLAAYRDQFPSGGTLELRADCSLLHWVAGLHADYHLISATVQVKDSKPSTAETSRLTCGRRIEECAGPKGTPCAKSSTRSRQRCSLTHSKLSCSPHSPQPKQRASDDSERMTNTSPRLRSRRSRAQSPVHQ